MTAIRKVNLITWPGIDQLEFNKILETTIATELGHLNQERENLRSTKIKKFEIPKRIMSGTQNITARINDA